MPVSVEVDWACQVQHDDPNCVRYDFRVPVGPQGERLGLPEQLLAEEVARGGWPQDQKAAGPGAAAARAGGSA